MVNFKGNFKNGNDDISCPLGCKEDDIQAMFLHCSVIQTSLPNINISGVKYSDIFSRNIRKMKEAGELLQKAFQVRTKIIEQKLTDEKN